MGNIGHAFFAERPRTIDDLMQPHLSAHEREYQIVKSIELGKMDYENFITDMLADRQFIEDNAGLCSRGDVWQCLLVRQRGCSDGIMVMPEGGCYVGWAALANDIEQSLDEADQAADSAATCYSAEKVFARIRKNMNERQY